METPVTAPPAGNGAASTTVRLVQTEAIAICLAACILIMALLAILCVWKPPQDWNLVSTVIGFINSLALLLAGALIRDATSRPSA